MTKIAKTALRTFAVAYLATLTVACNESVSLDTSISGQTRLLMQRDTSGTASQASPTDTATGSPRAVKPDTVEYFKVTVVGIDYLAAGASDTSDNSSAWTSVHLASSFDLDLNALPTTDSAARVIATGSVSAGAYSAVRLRIQNPRIKFKGSVSFGVAGILQGGTEYAVIIPSSAQTGLKASAAVSVQANGSSDVGLIFDCARSLGNVTVTGTGQVIMSAVLRAR